MDDQDARTVWCGNIHEKVSEEILYELFLQAGPLERVNIPKDRDGKQKNFGFVTYKHLCSVPYALDLFDGTSLFNRTLNLKNRNTNSQDNAAAQYFQQQQFMQQGNMFENVHPASLQNALQLNQQVLLGTMNLPGYNQNNMMPNSIGSYPYSSQSYDFSQSPQSSDHNSRARDRLVERSSRHNRNHPYSSRDDRHYDDRQNGRQEQYSRDHKSYRQSSHRSNRHDNRRKYQNHNR